MDIPVTICLALYRRLARAYPHEFRMLYGKDLEQLGDDAIPEIWRRYGVRGIFQLLADIAIRLPFTYLAEIRQDILYAVRVLLKARGFTTVAVLSIAIGIGMCSAVRSEIQSITGPAIGFHDPDALVTFRWSTVSYPYFERYRDSHPSIVAATAVMGPVPFSVASAPDKNSNSGRFYGHLVSPEYFSTLGVTPAKGRFFSPETERAGMPPVVVVSDRFWRNQLAADPDAVGRVLRLNGQPAMIVGIGPSDFLGIWPGTPADLFVPATSGTALAPELAGDPLHVPDRELFRVVFRLAPGVSQAETEAALNTVTQNLDRELGTNRDHVRVMRLMPAGTFMYATPEQRNFTNTFNVVLWGLVLVLVCANVANLLLARAGERRREIAVRISLGASRPRLVRQLLTEGILLSFVGGSIGIALGCGFMRVLSSTTSSLPVPVELHSHLDWQALGWTLLIAVLTGVGFGLAPALSCARADVARTLKEGSHAALRGYRRFGLRNLFVVGQVAASLMLVLVTAMTAAAFLLSSRINPGFDITELNLLSLDPIRDGYTAEQAAKLLETLPQELSNVEGVRSASFSGSSPFAWFSATPPVSHVTSADNEGRTGAAVQSVLTQRVGANYFATLGAPLLGGRDFAAREQWRATQPSTPVPVIVNQTAARLLFSTANPIGRTIREGDTSYTVVGISRDLRSHFLKSKPEPTMFLPFKAAQFRDNPAQGITILVRGTRGQNALASVRSHLRLRHPDLTIFHDDTLEHNLRRESSFIEWQSAIFVILGTFALMLACIGLGGVTAYAVARRRQEIGVRMALGARRGHVEGLVMKEGATLLAAGLVLGLGGAFALWRILAAYSDMLARTIDQPVSGPLLTIGTPLILASLTMLACYLPARRATRIEPAAALRQE